MCQLFLTIHTGMMLFCYMTSFGIMYERSSKVIMVSYSKNDWNGTSDKKRKIESIRHCSIIYDLKHCYYWMLLYLGDFHLIYR